MPPRSDLAGKRFGRVVVVRDVGSDRSGCRTWLVRCDCGVEKIVRASNLVRGHQKSCGCIVRTHGLSRSSTYKSWQMMWQRCTNTDNDNYPRYGAKGITVCEQWSDFENFIADMGERPAGTSLDRRDSKGNYEPGNCKWSTRRQQNVNTTRWVGFSALDGERISVREMAERLAISETFLRWRLCRREMRLTR